MLRFADKRKSVLYLKWASGWLKLLSGSSLIYRPKHQLPNQSDLFICTLCNVEQRENVWKRQKENCHYKSNCTVAFIFNFQWFLLIWFKRSNNCGGRVISDIVSKAILNHLLFKRKKKKTWKVLSKVHIKLKILEFIAEYFSGSDFPRANTRVNVEIPFVVIQWRKKKFTSPCVSI